MIQQIVLGELRKQDRKEVHRKIHRKIHRNSHRKMHGAIHSTFFCLLLACAAPALGQDVYRVVDADGVASFSDFPVDGAERVHVQTTGVSSDAASASEQLIRQQLEVAKALEESRLARQEAQTRRLQALAASRPQTVYYEVPRQTVYGGYWRPWRPGHGYRPGYGYRPGNRPGYGHRPGRPGKPGHYDSPGAGSGGHGAGGGRGGSRGGGRSFTKAFPTGR